MAFHFKSNKSFLLVIGASAFAISIMAALFSIIGVSSLFSGEMKTIVFMMAVLELAKVVLASYVAMYWKKLSKLIRTYFIVAILVLMTITSAGIFGYLSDAYQGTKGNYEQVDQSIKTEQIRLNFYDREIKDNDSRIAELRGMKRSYQLQLDSLVARNRSTYSVERALSLNDKEVSSLKVRNSIYNDSLSAIKLRIAIGEGTNSSGKLGPLRYMANVFNTSMDNVVKYFIFVLIFVFDPLAVLLFVSIAIIIRKDTELVIAKPEVEDLKYKKMRKEFEELYLKQQNMPMKDVLEQEDIIIPGPSSPTSELHKEEAKEIFNRLMQDSGSQEEPPKEISLKALPADENAVAFKPPEVEVKKKTLKALLLEAKTRLKKILK